MIQHDLFGVPQPEASPKKSIWTPPDELHRMAILYTATEKGNNSGIRFGMTVEHARLWCSSPISSGVLHGTRWAYFFSSVANFVTCYWCGQQPIIDLKGASDDGSWDKRISDLGLSKIGIYEFKAWLQPFGVTVENEPLHPSYFKSAA